MKWHINQEKQEQNSATKRFVTPSAQLPHAPLDVQVEPGHQWTFCLSADYQGQSVLEDLPKEYSCCLHQWRERQKWHLQHWKYTGAVSESLIL